MAIQAPTVPGLPVPARFLYGRWVQVRLLLFFLGAIAWIAALFGGQRLLGLDFGFLGREAGFGIGFRVIPYTEADTYARAFAVGLTNTLLVAVVAAVLATALGVAIGIARLTGNRALAGAARVFVEAVRNLPLLLHILFWQAVALQVLPPVRHSFAVGGIAFPNMRGLFVPSLEADQGWWPFVFAVSIGALAAVAAARGIRGRVGTALAIVVVTSAVGLAALLFGAPMRFEFPALVGFNFRGGLLLPPEFLVLAGALGLYNAAFIAELVRCSFESIGFGQWQAAAAIALTRGQAFRLVIVPQALRTLMPPLTNQYASLIKSSSLGIAIGYPELFNVFAGTALTQTGRAAEIMLITLLVYLALSCVMSFGMSRWNARIARCGGCS